MPSCSTLADLTATQIAALRTIAGTPPESERSPSRRRAWIATVAIPRMVFVMQNGEDMLAELGRDGLDLIEEHAPEGDPVPIVTFSPYGAALMGLSIHNREIVEAGAISDRPWWDDPAKPEPQVIIPRHVQAWSVDIHRPLRHGELTPKNGGDKPKEPPKDKPKDRDDRPKLKGGKGD